MAEGLFSVAIKGDLKAYATDHQTALARAITKSVRGAAGMFRTRLRRQIKQGFSDAPILGKTLIKKNTPQTGYVLNPASVTVPKAVYPAGTQGRQQDVDLVDLFTTAGTVHAAGHEWLAIPAPDAPWKGGRGTKRKATPAESGLKLVFLQTKKPNVAMLVVRHRGSKEVVIAYWLVKQTARPKLLDVDTALKVASDLIDVNFTRNWASEQAALESKYGTR